MAPWLRPSMDHIFICSLLCLPHEQHQEYPHMNEVNKCAMLRDFHLLRIQFSYNFRCHFIWYPNQFVCLNVWLTWLSKMWVRIQRCLSNAYVRVRQRICGVALKNETRKWIKKNYYWKLEFSLTFNDMNFISKKKNSFILIA